MKFGDRVRYADSFKERFGDRWPADMDEDGVVVMASDNPKTGQQVSLVMWDRDSDDTGWATRSPQSAMTTQLTRIGETPAGELDELRDRAVDACAQWGLDLAVEELERGRA